MLTEYPLRTIVKNLEATGRIAKWVTKIRPVRVTFESRTIIKGQVLADFIVKFTPGPPPQRNHLKGWILNMDDTSNSRDAGIEIALTIPEGSIIEQSNTQILRHQ